jgi:hypothetical protein
MLLVDTISIVVLHPVRDKELLTAHTADFVCAEIRYIF